MCKRNFKKNEFFRFREIGVGNIYNRCLCDEGFVLFRFNPQKSALNREKLPQKRCLAAKSESSAFIKNI